MRSLRLALALALVASLVPAVVASPSYAARLGVVSDLTWTGSWDDQDRSAAMAVDLTARWVKLTVDWNRAEPSPGRYDWDLIHYYDRAVGLTRASGARVLMLVSRSPRWASYSDNVEAPPVDPSTFGRFLGFLARRWTGDVAAWEIWNEPNTKRFWPSGPNPWGYVALLKAAYREVKAADPVARVVFGGVANLTPGARRFVNESYAAGAKGHFDVLGWHAYTLCGKSSGTFWYNPRGEITPASFLGYRTVRNDMVSRWRDQRPIWITEFGWSTSTERCDVAWTSGVNEDVQAQRLREASPLLDQDAYVQVALWYTMRNNFWDADADHIEARFGLARSNWSRKPAYFAFRTLAAGAP